MSNAIEYYRGREVTPPTHKEDPDMPKYIVKREGDTLCYEENGEFKLYKIKRSE